MDTVDTPVAITAERQSGAPGQPGTTVGLPSDRAPLRPQGRGSRLGTAVVQALVDDIVSGRFPPGAALPPEADLCVHFDVSRTVVRESVKVVQEKGLVRIVQGKGTQVTDSREWNMIDEIVLSSLIRQDESLNILDELITVRAALEREMAAAAARVADTGQKGRIADALAAMRNVADSVALFSEADVAFHDVVMELSQNRLGRAIVTSIHDKARTNVRYHGSYTDESIVRTLAEHTAIAEAIQAGDPEAADRAMWSHIMDSWNRRRPSTRKYLTER
ncbi:FadR family transcriptional regulator [Jatrophihabitans telluris]|uniref:FadR family transcriptional regulator n=1 Tax=Jatrophihabitans telluris TaxID=2038343 RepID=A0ABY4R1T1_9ACTN|nr:FadR/GntR family transcriptional regulator [Jatrophihabitans telluris]UQX89753.1 FadR family transcriptional regulator [Jatrophihabitans telluris]